MQLNPLALKNVLLDKEEVQIIQNAKLVEPIVHIAHMTLQTQLAQFNFVKHVNMILFQNML